RIAALTRFRHRTSRSRRSIRRVRCAITSFGGWSTAPIAPGASLVAEPWLADTVMPSTHTESPASLSLFIHTSHPPTPPPCPPPRHRPRAAPTSVRAPPAPPPAGGGSPPVRPPRVSTPGPPPPPPRRGPPPTGGAGPLGPPPPGGGDPGGPRRVGRPPARHQR